MQAPRFSLLKHRAFLAAAILLFGVCGAVGQATTDNRLMNDAEYKTFLSGVDTQIPKWEMTFKNLDLEKVPQLSYAQGKSIADQRDAGLLEVGYIKDFVGRQRRKRTVSGELALKSFLESLYGVGQEIVWEESFTQLTLTDFDKYAPALSSLVIQIANDVLARVDLLEKDSCGP